MKTPLVYAASIILVCVCAKRDQGSWKVLDPEKATDSASWTEWRLWSTCSYTCDQGSQKRIRKCVKPRSYYISNECPGNWEEQRVCFDYLDGTSFEVTASSGVNNGPVQAVVDGSYWTGLWYSDTMSTTDWLQIDMLEERSIYGAVVVTRFDLISRFYAYQVRVGNTETAGERQEILWNTVCDSMVDGDTTNYYESRNWAMLCIQGPLKGRYLTVSRYNESPQYMEIVEVFMMDAPKPDRYSELHAMMCLYKANMNTANMEVSSAGCQWDCLELCQAQSDCRGFTWTSGWCHLKAAATTEDLSGSNAQHSWSGIITDDGYCKGFQFEY